MLVEKRLYYYMNYRILEDLTDVVICNFNESFLYCLRVLWTILLL